MMRLLIVIPWSPFHVGLKDFDFAQMPERAPESMVALATFLREKGAEVAVADMQCHLLQCQGDTAQALQRLYAQCNEWKPEVIGFSFFTARLKPAADIFEGLRNHFLSHRLPLPLMIAGGVHATLLPQLTFQQIPFDALIVGEGEMPLWQLLRGEDMNEIPGVVLPGANRITPPRVVEHLDELPPADWSLIDFPFYTQPAHLISSGRLDAVLPVTFGRGCNYRCNFCAHACFLKPRCHSAEGFLRKLDAYAAQCHVNTFLLQDSSIGNYKKEWAAVCQALIARGTPYRWWANLRANQADREFLELLKRAGCIKLFFGFESGSQRVLDRMNKRITVEQCRETARLCHELDIPFYASFIVNYFGETEEDLALTEQLILQTRPTSVAVNTFSPIPGSKDYDAHRDEIVPHLNSLDDWTMLGCLYSQLYFSHLPKERFDYWRQRRRNLRHTINAHEDSD